MADGNIAIDWFTNNDMMANTSKFQFMTIGDSNGILTLRGVAIEQDNNVTFLGVNIPKKIILNLLNCACCSITFYGSV